MWKGITLGIKYEFTSEFKHAGVLAIQLTVLKQASHNIVDSAWLFIFEYRVTPVQSNTTTVNKALTAVGTGTVCSVLRM